MNSQQNNNNQQPGSPQDQTPTTPNQQPPANTPNPQQIDPNNNPQQNPTPGQQPPPAHSGTPQPPNQFANNNPGLNNPNQTGPVMNNNPANPTGNHFGQPPRPPVNNKGSNYIVIGAVVVGLIAVVSAAVLIFVGLGDNKSEDPVAAPPISEDDKNQKQSTTKTDDQNEIKADDRDKAETDDGGTVITDEESLTPVLDFDDDAAVESFNADDDDVSVRVVTKLTSFNFFYEPSTPATCRYYVSSLAVKRNKALASYFAKYKQDEPIELTSGFNRVISDDCGDWKRVPDRRQRNTLALNRANTDNVNQSVRMNTFWLKYQARTEKGALAKEFYYKPTKPSSCRFFVSSAPDMRRYIDNTQSTDFIEYKEFVRLDFREMYLMSEKCGDWQRVNGIAKSDSTPVPKTFNTDNVDQFKEIIDDYKDNFNQDYYYLPETPKTCQYSLSSHSGLYTYSPDRKKINTFNGWLSYKDMYRDNRPLSLNNSIWSHLITKNCGDFRQVDGD